MRIDLQFFGGRGGGSGKGGKAGGGGRGRAVPQTPKGTITQSKEFMGGKQRTVTRLVYTDKGGERHEYRYTNIRQAQKFAKDNGIELE